MQITDYTSHSYYHYIMMTLVTNIMSYVIYQEGGQDEENNLYRCIITSGYGSSDFPWLRKQ